MKSFTHALVLASILGAGAGFAPQQLGGISTVSTTRLGLFGRQNKSANAPQSKLANEAVELYQERYPNTGDSPAFFFQSWGMPQTEYSENKNRRIFSVDEQKLRKAFGVVSRLYGEENALEMVRILPGLLAFNSDNFEPCLGIYGEKFGLDESKEMVMRNPGLLASKPASAETADDLTMQLSYVVQYTRPIGIAGPYTLLALLSVPVLEGITGVSRAEFLSSLTG